MCKIDAIVVIIVRNTMQGGWIRPEAGKRIQVGALSRASGNCVLDRRSWATIPPSASLKTSWSKARGEIPFPEECVQNLVSARFACWRASATVLTGSVLQ